VNVWLWCATALVLALIPLALLAALRPPHHGVVALAAAGAIAALALLLLSEGTRRQGFADLAIVVAVGSFAGTVAFLHFLARIE